MLRANLIVLFLCMAVGPAKSQTALVDPLLQLQLSQPPAAPIDAAAVNSFDRFLHMAGTATLGAGVGTGVLWGVSQLSISDDEGRIRIYEDSDVALYAAVLIGYLSPWIGASLGAYSMSGLRWEQWNDENFATTMFFGGLGSVVGIAIGGGLESPVAVPTVAGFIVGTGIGAALGAVFVTHQRGGFLQYDRERWHLELVGTADGGGLSLVSLSF